MDMYGTEDELLHERTRVPAEQQAHEIEEEAERHDVPTEAARGGEISEGAPHEGEEGQDVV